jgi:hypothetical protein
MDLSVTTLEGLLESVGAEDPGSPDEAVAFVRQSQPSIAPTLYSAWQRDGRELNPALRYELELQRGRMTTYRELAEKLRDPIPGAVPLKGFGVADHYPAGLVRYMNDLDYWVPDEAELWRGAAALAEWGWEVWQATFQRAGSGGLRVLVSLRRPHEDPYCFPYGVELATYLALGDLGGVRTWTELPAAWSGPELKNLLMLLYERLEQPYRARDLLDAALLLDALPAADRPVLEAAITERRLWPEYAELATRLARTPLPGAAAAPRIPLAAARLARGRTLAESWRSPVDGGLRHLQRRLMFGGHRPVERRAWSVVTPRLTAERALAAGLLVFGLPVDGPAAGDRAKVTSARGTTWADTPVGRLLLSAGDEVSEDELDALP